MRDLKHSELDLVFGGDTGSNIPGVSGADLSSSSYGNFNSNGFKDKKGKDPLAYANEQARLANWLAKHPGLTEADFYRY
ncbi:hypothetical protein GCM10008941_17680 [Rhizomicrobium palustre]